MEPYFPTLLPSKVTLNYSKHVFSSVNCIWPLYDRSDGLRGYIPRPPEAISSFESLFERIPDGLQGTCLEASVTERDFGAEFVMARSEIKTQAFRRISV